MVDHATPLKNVKLARVSTVAFFIDTQLNAQINLTISFGSDVSVIASESSLNRPIDGCQYFSIEIPRQIRPIKDLVALLKLWRLFRSQDFDIVHSTTPKAGFLCAIAGRLSGVPIRIHTFTGQPWVTLKGIKRHVVKFGDKLIGFLNTVCYADSFSQKFFLVSEGVISADKLLVIGKGSLAGVDINRFNPELFSEADRYEIKKDLGIAKDSIVLLFIGRIVRDKGVVELVEAFNRIIDKHLNVCLLFVGPQELSKTDLGIVTESTTDTRVKFIGYTDVPEKYMAVSDVLCIPSYREGFGTVVIEAAAMGLPAVGSNIYGLSDAIVNGKTGLLVEPKNVEQLTNALLKFFNDIDLCQLLGQNAQKRTVQYFSSELVNQQVIDEYIRLLSKEKRS
jgi:glycosyltransferase involved in cell wall biosynthesis